MLHLKGLSKKFNGMHVLHRFSAQVDKEDFVVIMGHNGAGKSTLFDLISGKTPLDEGSIEVDGMNLASLPERKRAQFVGRLFQNTYLGSCCNLTIRENLAMAHLKGRKAGLGRGSKKCTEEMVETLLKPLNLNLEKLIDLPMGALSGGQRQIISFLIATLIPPKIMLLDEPTAALDPETATKLLLFAIDYAKKEEIPTLLITHDPMIAKHLGNRLWILKSGGIEREFGPEKSLMNPQDLVHPILYEQLR